MNKLEPINSLEDVFYYTAKKHGKSPEHVRFIYMQLFKAVKYYLTRPHLCGIGINIKNFIKFRFRENAVKSYYYNLLDRINKEDPELEKTGKYNNLLTDLKYYEQLLEMIEFNKETEKRNRKNG